MKRWIRAASYFYPLSWRRRYAAEFDAMLEAVDPQWHDVFDILKGALLMQFKSWNLKSITLAFAAIGAVLAAVAAFRIPAEYQSQAVLRLQKEGAPYANLNDHLGRLAQSVLSRGSLEQVVTGLGLYPKDRETRPLEDIVQDMRRNINLSKIGRGPGRPDDTVVFSVKYRYPDPRLAQAAVRQMVNLFTAANVDGQRGDIAPQAAENLDVLDPPSNPQQPVSPHKAPVILAGLFAGVLLGLTVSYAMRWRIVIVRRPAN